MYIDGKILDILYRQVAPGRLLNKLIEKMGLKTKEFIYSADSYDMADRALFMDFAETMLVGYSEDEQNLLYDRLRQQRDHWKEKHIFSSGFLVPLIEFAIENLVIKDDGIVCRNDSILSWREIYLRLGQDIPICAYLAYNDCENVINRLDFSWPAIIRVDDSDLYHVLDKGMAENHNHLNGGTQSFQITWCRMMNYPEKIRTELPHFEGSNLNPKMNRGNNGRDLDVYAQLELAALLRSILFRALHREAFNITDYKENERTFDGEIAFYKEYIGSFSTENEVYHIVDCLRGGYGAKLDMPDKMDFCLDYMLNDRLLQRCKNSDARVLVGERVFLYRCMRSCMEKQRFSGFEQNLFYLYLVLQCNFRSEMIQANNQTGFKNFQNFQDRKDDAWEANPYFWEAVRLGLNSRLNSEAIVSLEARIVPKADLIKNLQKVVRFDTAKKFADCSTMENIDDSKYAFDCELDVKQFTDVPYFFVFHFVKLLDNRCLDLNSFVEPCCRHQEHRENVKRAVEGLANALCEYPYLRSRVRGIDAASNEFGCRPEVFAVAYRYIDALQKKWNARLDMMNLSSPMRISKTYHVGEDFLDIADGMRAIDEAIEYLEMGACSRIGHALALGVDPEKHYRTKHYEIVTTKQDRLDDLVWLLYRSKEFGVTIHPTLESQFYGEANHLFREIYGKAVQKNLWDCDLEKYRCSMKLRCDDPLVYSKSNPEVIRMSADGANAYAINTTCPELDYYRKDDCISGLYYYYQYGIYEGICGKETYTYKVTRGYMALMRAIQEAMMFYLNKKKIIIECNPSSNVLIGSFKKYEEHPIFRFNNRKLSNRYEPDAAQLHVCVNTDDLGVFDTSLEFEYALLYQALTGQMNDSGRPVYSERDVMEYIDDLREMGIRATFPANIG